MKQVKILIAFAAGILATATSQATIYVVNNSAANPGQFYYLQAAIDSAEAGDTLMVQPSTVTYGDVSLNKGLTLIGIGHKPLKDLPLVATINTVTMNDNLNGATFIGLKIVYLVFPCNCYGCWKTTSNITVRNCDVSLNDSNPNSCYGFNVANNFLVENSVLRGLSFPTIGNNILVQNCMIYTFGIGFGASMTNVVVKNNLFLYESSSNWGVTSANGVVFENNIFFRFNPTSGNVTNCIFNNNLTYQTNNDVIVGGTNTGSDNIVGQDPLFANLLYSASPIYQPVSYNYRLQDLSPGHLAGTDGQDIGPYGNNMIFSETGESDDQPVIRVMNLLHSTVPSSGTINVHVKATASKND